MSTPDTQPFNLDKLWVKRSFNGAADTYDQNAVLQKEVGSRMLERFDLLKISPRRILDVGCGTGSLSRALLRRFPNANIVNIDIALNMLFTARQSVPWWQKIRPKQSWLCADAVQIPLRSGSADIIVSNLTLQWCDDLESTLREFRRVLAPEGLLMFTSVGPDTLKELRASWREVDDYNHVNAFLDMHDVGDALIRAGFGTPVMDQEYITLTFPTVVQMMRELKAIGAHNVTAGRRRGLLGRQQLENLTHAYERYRSNGVLPCTYEIVYGHAWAPSTKSTHEGESHVPLTKIQRRSAAP